MMDMRFIWIPLVLLCSAPAQTDPRLEALHTTLQSLHDQAGTYALNRGGGPNLTLAKHQLRDWIDTQLGLLEKQGDESSIADKINKALEAVSVAPPKDDENSLGSLGQVDLAWESGFLMVTTRVGIVCQQDESAYGYKRIDGRWQRVWESEQNDYRHYTPQQISSVHLWQSYEGGKETGPTYILTLGNDWGCVSAWHPVYYRIWRVDSSGSKILVDQSGGGYLRGESYIVGSIVNSPMHFSGPVDAVIEFTQASIDPVVHNREAIRHFLIKGDRVSRVEPVALSPRDFVDEWLTSPWTESRRWSQSSDLRQWHQRLHSEGVGGEFVGTTLHCQTPDLWQVGFGPYGSGASAQPTVPVYFLIRWMPPYRFSLADISDQPWPRCTQPDNALFHARLALVAFALSSRSPTR